jgi:flavin reductase (DIM6/NTAB) family NADH-FMN oxidoreductase RutF
MTAGFERKSKSRALGLAAPTGEDPATVAKLDFVSAMRNVVSGVAIITTLYESRLWGMTVSAFTTVCAEPPTLMVCVNSRTVLAAVLHEGSGFGVNVLSQDQEFLSRACARPGTSKFLDHYVDLVDDGSSSGGLLLPTSVAAFDCVVSDARTVGTHLVVLGAVREVTTSDRVPLLYGSGAYQCGTSDWAPDKAMHRALAWA